MKIETLKNDFIFSSDNPMLSIGIRKQLRYVSGMCSYVSLTNNLVEGLSPEIYIQFAQRDILDGDERSSINALGHAKRAVHLLIDSLFELLGLGNLYENSKFPEKIELIQQLELFPTRLISRLNKLRNEVEHDYDKISADTAKDFVEVAELFYLLCTPFLKRIVNSVHVGLINDERDIMWLLNPFNSKVSIHECFNSPSIESLNGKVYYNYSDKSEDIKLLKLISMTKKNKEEWIPILNTLIFSTKKNIAPENPPYDPSKASKIMMFSSNGKYIEDD